MCAGAHGGQVQALWAGVTAWVLAPEPAVKEQGRALHR